MSDMAKNANSRGSVIIDAPKVFVTLLAIVFLSYVVWRMISSPAPVSNSLSFWFCTILDILFLIRFFVISKGFVIDIENDTLTFPGGGIEADSWTSYFNPTYLLQRFQRHKVNLSEIREIQIYTDVVDDALATMLDENRRRHKKKKNMLEINGNFGSVSFDFWSKGKRNQLYSAIVNINEMGDPMVYR